MVNGERPIELVCGIVPIQALWPMVYGPWSVNGQWTILSLNNVLNQNPLVA